MLATKEPLSGGSVGDFGDGENESFLADVWSCFGLRSLENIWTDFDLRTPSLELPVVAIEPTSLATLLRDELGT